MTTPRPTAVPSGLSRHVRGRLLMPGDPEWDTAQPPLDTAERIYPSATRDRLRHIKGHYDANDIILPSFPC